MTTTYPTDAANGSAFRPASSRGDVERTYRVALRHSRHVRFLRLAVLGGIAAVLAAVIVIDYLPPVDGFRLPGELGKLVIKGTKITMAQPRLSGFTSDGRPYQFNANAAAQDITKPDLVELEHIKAKMGMADQSTVNLTADRGIYDMKADTLVLNDNIVLVSSTGYEGYLSEALVDIHKGDVTSVHPVRVKLLNGWLDARNLQVIDRGDTIRFGGGVTMILHQDKPAADTGAGAGAATAGPKP